MRRGLRIATVSLFAVLGVLPSACNIFLTLDQCSSDGDCPESYACDRKARFCVRTGEPPDSSPEADAVEDAGVEAALEDVIVADVVEADAPPPCDRSAAFGNLSLVKGLEDRSIGSARLTSDEKTLVFSAFTGCQAETCIDLYIASRGDSVSSFAVGSMLPGVNVPTASEYWPTFTTDGKVLFLESSRSVAELPDGGYTSEQSRIWTATRSNETVQFAKPFIQDIFKVDPAATEGAPYLHPNGKTLYFMSNGRPGHGALDLYVATLGALGAASSIENIDAVNSDKSEMMPMITLDERTLYFTREEGTSHRIMVSKRATSNDAFGAPSYVNELNLNDEWPAWISDDECRLYFVSNRAAGDAGAGVYRLWVGERPKTK